MGKSLRAISMLTFAIFPDADISHRFLVALAQSSQMLKAAQCLLNSRALHFQPTLSTHKPDIDVHASSSDIANLKLKVFQFLLDLCILFRHLLVLFLPLVA